MKIENQVVNLELSKKLKELGVKQEGQFYWWGNREETKTIIAYRKELISEVIIPVGIRDKGYCSAFTVAELGEILPTRIQDGHPFELETNKQAKKGWAIRYYNYSIQESRITFADDNEANARAKMLIYLIENKLIDLKGGE